MNKNNQYSNINNASVKGLTLVEVMVAVCVLIASLTVLLLSFSRGTHGAGTARCQLNAIQIAREEIEQFHSTDYTNILAYPLTNLNEFIFDSLNGQKQCTVTNIDDVYKEITVNISWKSTANSLTISQSYNTIICNTN